MHKYICYLCDKEFKEYSYYTIHLEKNLCTFISGNTIKETIEIDSYLYKLNKQKKTKSSINLNYHAHLK